MHAELIADGEHVGRRRRLGDGDASANAVGPRWRLRWRSGSAGRRQSSITQTGCQYTSIAFRFHCREAGVRPSMGDAYDNALCASFFATVECELLDRRRFKTLAEARMAIFDSVERWYNPQRRHSGLGYDSPMTSERRFAQD